MNAQAARPRRLPTGRRGNTPGGSLRIVSGLAANTNSIICDGSREPETANGCPVMHRMRGPSAVRHSCATLNPDQSNARSPERAQRPRVFFLTLTYMEVGKPLTWDYFRVARHSSRISGRAQRDARRTHRDWFGTEEFRFQEPEGVASGFARSARLRITIR